MAQMSGTSGGSHIPPIDRDGGLPAEPPGWPKGLGVFSIVWGSLGIVCGGCINFFAFAGTAFYEWGRQQQVKAGQPDMGPMPRVPSRLTAAKATHGESSPAMTFFSPPTPAKS